jgi:hypothetical protein
MSRPKAFIVTLRRGPEMPPEAYYLLAKNERSAVRAAKRMCETVQTVVLGVVAEPSVISVAA